jgi:arsenate reductase
VKILYICTHNRCRSILSEAITNHLSKGKILAKSAGSQPAGQVHPLSLMHLQQVGISTDYLACQSWHELENFAPDVVITVCDSAAKEPCPLWFGDAMRVHWSLADPSKCAGTHDEISQAFNSTIKEISSRVQQLLSLQDKWFDPQALQAALVKFGAS